MSDYSVEIKIRNARVLRLMRLAGLKRVSDLSRLSGVSQTRIATLINLKMNPMSNITGTWKPMVLLLADALNCMPEDMFSDHQRTSFLASNKRSIEMSETEVDLLMDSREQVLLPDDVVLAAQRKGHIVALLDEILTPRQADVLKKRFGLDGDGEKTLEELGSTLGVVGEGVRQIEIKALRRLRHPSNRKHLEAYL
jgi:DNA-directed RNA polymerase sigma subunit (sigma70/sigma32)